MPDFSRRIFRNELMDNPGIPDELLVQNLIELDILNRYTRGHAISITGLKKLNLQKNKEYKLLDIGCGSGDSMLYMAKWALREGYKIKFTGIDTSKAAIEYLTYHCKSHSNIQGIKADCFSYLNNPGDVDIVHCSLFCHHLDDDELRNLFIMLKEKINHGIIINDLQRVWMAWCASWLLPRVLNGSPLAKHDGPVSVLKGFKRGELNQVIHQSGMYNYTIEPMWPFRYLITMKLKE